MSASVDMSLEDIIRKKNVNRSFRPKKNPIPSKGKMNQPLVNQIPITDARNKIVSKKRKQITDAREILVDLAKQRDARLKLEMLRQQRGVHPNPASKGQPNLISRGQQNLLRGQMNAAHRLNQNQVPRGRQIVGKLIRNVAYKDRVFSDPTRQVASRPLGLTVNKTVSPKGQNIARKFLNNRSIGRRPFDKSSLKPIVRTIENDVEIIDDPMDVDEEDEMRTAMLNRKATLQLKIIAKNDAGHETRISSLRRKKEEREKSPPRPPSILKKRPMAALRMDERQDKQARTSQEYRIIVSNLRNTVTGGDIEELFGDVGNLVESRLVRPGTAEVIYKTMEDAQRAVELYHNRQLDGQAMNCLLVAPRSPSAAPSRSTSKPAFISSNSNVEPDPSTFHKVMFNTY